MRLVIPRWKGIRERGTQYRYLGQMDIRHHKISKTDNHGFGGKLAIPTSGSHIWSYEKQNKAQEGSMEIEE
jgi:hypothetical protein